MKKLAELVKQQNGKKILITFHKQGDFDSIASSILLKKIITTVCEETKTFVCAQGITSREEKYFLSQGYEILDEFKKTDTIFILDTQSPVLLEPMFERIKKSAAQKILIDHHHPVDVSFADHVFVDEKAVATAEIIYRLLKTLNLPVDKETTRLVGAALIRDTANYVSANKNTFKILWEILEKSGETYEKVQEFSYLPTDDSEKIAKLKAAQRLKLDKCKQYYIATTTVSSFEGTVANSILGLGADVCFVSSENKKEKRIAARARNALVSKGFHLGRDIMPAAGKIMGGEGGGHAAAAGANGKKNLNEAVLECVRLSKKFLKGL